MVPETVLHDQAQACVLGLGYVDRLHHPDQATVQQAIVHDSEAEHLACESVDLQ